MVYRRAKARPTLRPPGTFGMRLRTPSRLEPRQGTLTRGSGVLAATGSGEKGSDPCPVEGTSQAPRALTLVPPLACAPDLG